MRVLVIRLGAFGDIVHTLPLAAGLAAAGHEVGWLCEDRWSCLLEGSAAVSRIHRLPRRIVRTAPVPQRIRAVTSLVRDLRSTNYDLVIDAQGLAKSAALAALAGGLDVVGHAPPRSRELAWLAYGRTATPSAVHVIDQQLALGSLVPGCDATAPWAFPLPAWAADRAWAEDWLAKAGLDGCWMLNVGAGWPTKVWPEVQQIAFARACATAGRRLLVLWGSPAEREVAERVATAGAATLAPPSSIPQLGGLIARAAVLVSGDTGPLHLSLALGTPAVGLFGPVPAERNGPRGAAWRNLQAPGAAWERRDVSKVDMGAITVEQVLAEAAAVARAR